MPAFNLTVEDSSVEDVTITQAGDAITVGGTYVLSIKNNGVLPVLMGATLTVDKLEVTGVVAEEGKSSTVSGAGDVEIDFSFTQNSSQYLGTAQSLCSGQGQIDIEATGRIDGLVLGSSFNQSTRDTVPSARCSLESSNGSQEPPENGGGGGGGIDPQPPGDDPDPEPPGGDPEPDPPDSGGGGGGGGGGGTPPSDGSQPNPQGAEIVNIDAEQGNYEDPYVNTEQTYQLQQNGQQMSSYADPDEFTWTWDFAREERVVYDERTSRFQNASQQAHTWENTGQKTVQLTIVYRETGETYLQETLQQNVVENEGGGGLFTLDEDQVPSMSEAADMKEREY